MLNDAKQDPPVWQRTDKALAGLLNLLTLAALAALPALIVIAWRAAL